MVLYLAGGTKRCKSMLGIPEIADNYCLEGSKIKISLKCFGMLCFALLCFGGKSFKTFSLKNLHQPLDQNEGFKLKTTYIKHAGGTGAKHLFINAAKLRFQSWYMVSCCLIHPHSAELYLVTFPRMFRRCF